MTLRAGLHRDVECAAVSLTLGLLIGKPEPSYCPCVGQAAVPGSR
jgi:hypothetical protein